MDKIDEILTRGVEEIIDKKHWGKRLRSGEKLWVKLGIDPTSPNIHIGRAVVLWKLRAFQELGHKIVFIIGDFTGLIGDTSDKDAERSMMSEEEIKKNTKNYFEQAGKILDKSQTEMHYNSEWLGQLGFKKIGEMADLFGLHQFETRENIARRLEQGKRVSLRELLYPLMQGYDSVAIKADLELGGTDQKFNLLAGRDIQKLYGQEPQDIMTMTLLEGTDGRKMSSSWDNVINLTDESNEMFGKIMSLNDDLIKKYFILATMVPLRKIDDIMRSNPNPRDQKLILAEKITAQYHGEKLAQKAKEIFISLFSKKEIPEDIEEIKTKKEEKLENVLIRSKIVSSKSEFRRLIKAGAIDVDSKPISDVNYLVEKPIVVKIGKKKFLKIKI
jgi:tyrosyl-tRNA synthetase